MNHKITIERLLLATLCLVLMYMHGWAQHPVATVKYSYNQFTRFKNYSIHDGLSNVPVFDILKDKRGFLWLATGDGLVRFDGHSFLYYRYKPKDSTSIPYSDCRALAEDWQGRIWVGTTNGLGCLDPVSGLCSRYYKGADSLSLILQNDVRALLVCSDGYLWAEQTGGVLSRINLQRQRAAHFKRNGREKVTVHYFFVHETRNRRILAGGGHNEPFCYDKKNGQTSLLNRNPDRSKNPFYIATNMLEDESGLYWITNQENGLTIYNPQTDTLSHGRLPSLYTITADGKGNIFMGGLISGLMQFNTRTNKFTRYMPNENNPLSIPSKHICKLYFDSDGNLWIGHSKGLSLYSPHANKFHHVWHIPETPSLSSNTITSICQVDQDNIWFGTREQGATLYHLPDNLFTTYKEVKDDPSTLSSNWITAIDHDSKNRVWFSLWTGHESAINSFNPATGKFTRHLATDNYYWYFDVKCQGENIFAGSWGTGLLECDKKTNKFVISYPAHEESTIPFRQVAPFLNADSTGNIWFGTSRYYNPNTNKSKIFDISYGIRRRTIRSVNTPFQTDFPSNILMQLVDHSNRLCILCNLSRILVLDPADETLIPIKFNLHNYYNLALGHKPGQLLIGGSDTILVLNTDRASQRFILTNRRVGNIHAIHVSPDNEFLLGTALGLWKGTMNGSNELKVSRIDTIPVLFINEVDHKNLIVNRKGVWIYSRTNKTLSQPLPLKAIAGSSVVNVSCYGAGCWITLPERIVQFDCSQNSHLEYIPNPKSKEGLMSNQLYDVCQVNDTTVWVAGDKGVSSLNPKTGHFNNYSAPSSNVITNYLLTCLMVDRQGNIWAGTYNGWGANRINRQTGHIDHFVNVSYDSTSLSGDNVYQIYEGRDGTIWMATETGLHRNIKGTNQFRRYGRAHGLLANEVLAILDDDKGFIWTSHQKGLSRLNPKTGEVRTYTWLDGAQIEGYYQKSCAKLLDGRLAFGGNNGITIFHPDSIRENAIKPQVFITAIKANGDTVRQAAPLDELALPYSQRHIEVEIACSDFSIPDRILFAYSWRKGNRVLAADTLASRAINFSNLKPGVYSLYLSATNCDGLWGDQICALRLKIMTPFWLKWWFILIEIALFTGLLWLIVAIRDRYLSSKKRMLEQEIEKRTRELQQITKTIINRKEQVQDINNQLTDNLEYAKYFQERVLQTHEQITEILNDCSLLYQKSSLIGSDFYWAHMINGYRLVVVGDHINYGLVGGVTGMIVLALLKEVVYNQGVLQPNRILDNLRSRLIYLLYGVNSNQPLPSGTGISVCLIKTSTGEIEYAGARSSIWIISKKDVNGGASAEILTGDNYRLDSRVFPQGTFSLQKRTLHQQDVCILFSRGVGEFFASNNNFTEETLAELSLNTHIPINAQVKLLQERIRTISTTNPAKKDLTVLGVRV